MSEHDNEWSRTNAEKHIADVLDAAKDGPVQTIVDFDGNFEVRFVPPLPKPGAAGLTQASEAITEPFHELEVVDDPAIRPV